MLSNATNQPKSTTELGYMCPRGPNGLVIPHTKKVNVGFRLHFELTESFAFILG